jgi:hypothetical protein
VGIADQIQESPIMAAAATHRLKLTQEGFWQGIGLGDPAFHNLAFDQGIAEAHYGFPE